MEMKIVVMSGADVAAMRKAHKEAEKAYFDAKVGALEFAAEEMRATNKEYSLNELSTMTGLTSMELVAQLGWNCRAARQAGIGERETQWGKRTTERKFVEVLPNGEINPNNVMTVCRCETVFRMTPKRR